MLSCTYTPSPHNLSLGRSHPSPLLSPSLLHLLPHSLGSLPTALGHQPPQEIELSPSHGRDVQSGLDTGMGALYGICSAWTFLRTQEGGIFLHVLTSQQENFSPHYGTLAEMGFSVSKLQ